MHAPELSKAAIFGEDHTAFGEIEVREVAGSVALALSRGRYPKGYPTLDLNEDAVMGAVLGTRILLAVADGHWGFDASRAALRSIDDSAPDLLAMPGTPGDVVRAGLESAAAAVRRELATADEERARSRTTLTVACFEPDGGAAGGFGDSQAVLIGPGGGRPVWRPAPFLGTETNPGDAWLETSLPVAGTQKVAVASDGLLDFLGRRWPARLAELRDLSPRRFVATAIEGAFAGGAGDHIAVAVAGFSDPEA